LIIINLAIQYTVFNLASISHQSSRGLAKAEFGADNTSYAAKVVEKTGNIINLKNVRFTIGVKSNQCSKTAKIRKLYLSLNTLLGLDE
jgi:hypothetical protein